MTPSDRHYGWVARALSWFVLSAGVALVALCVALLVRPPGPTGNPSAPIARACSEYQGPDGTTVGDCPSLTPQPATTAIAQPLVPVATSTAQPVTPASGPSEAPAQGSHDVLGRFALQQGQTITNTVTVTSGCPDLVVSVNWQSGEVSTVMTSPSGRQITASTQAADVTQNGDPTWQYYMVSFPEIGVWNILTTGVSVEPGGETINVNVDAMPPIPPEVLAFANPYSGSAPLKVVFSSSANDLEGGTITSYTWDFGDGSSGTGPTPTHTYARAGSYVATLTVTSSEGEEASASTSQIVVGAA